MAANTKSTTPVKQAKSTLCECAGHSSICRFSGRSIWVFSIMLGLLLVAGGQLQAAGQFDSQRDTAIDSRWLPWIGSWRLVSNTVNTTDRDLEGEYLLDISPGKRETAVTVKAFQDEKVLFEDTIVADGSSQSLKDKECSGWHRYSWSDTGKRLLFESESSCPGELLRKISGIFVIDDYGEWLDIQLLQDQNERIITIRRYSPVDEAEDLAGHGIRATRRARLASGASFSIDEIIELSNKVASEVLEAAIMELHKPFKINSKTLVHLADAGVPTPVIDLMVALSFPEKFHVVRDTIHLAEKADSTSSVSGRGYPYPPYMYYTVYDPFYPWYWTPYTYPYYWYSYWGVWPCYGCYPGPGPGGGDGQRTSGRLVAGHGYTKVNPRDSSSAQPRNSATPPPGSVSSSSGSSGASFPSSSPSGYSSGSITSGRARPR
jgi:hypothetical protein